MKTIIAVPDFTREAHLKEILPKLIRKLNNEKVSNKDIEVIIATGLHRQPTKKEIKANLGAIVDKIKISVHNYNQKYVSYFGRTKNGIPIYLNKKLKNAHSIITIGVVEPHLYAGYSGGTKVVAIGLAGEKTINTTHHPRFMDHPETRICSVTKNPFRAFIDEVSKMLPITHSINIVNDANGSMLKIFEGSPHSSFQEAVSFASKIFEKKINKRYDVVICNSPASKSSNIYQASRAFNYIANTRKTILKNRPIIIVKADLKEGFGKGLVEKRFMDIMTKIKDPKKFIRGIKKRGCLAGEHRAYMVARAMLKARLGFISKNTYLYKNKTNPFLFFRNQKEANGFIKKYFNKKPSVYYLRNAFSTILRNRK